MPSVRLSGLVVRVSIDDPMIKSNSLMAMMAAGIKCGEEIEIRAEGPEEEAAGRAIVDFIAQGMGD